MVPGAAAWCSDKVVVSPGGQCEKHGRVSGLGKPMNAQTFATVGQSIAWHAAHTPHHVAIVRQGGPVTYRRLARDLARCVHGMPDFNVTSGTLVGLALSHRYTHLLVALGGELAGAAVTPVLS